MSGAAIELRGLTKVFGDVRALDAVDLVVPEGSVFGFLGPNGAGKTTALRIIAGLARPTAGEALVFDRDVVRASNEARTLVGFLPDVPGFYPWMTAREFLGFVAGLFALDPGVAEDRIEVLLDMSGLEGVETRIGGYSRGMRQRLGIAQALVNAPRLLLLDEPTSALDPIGRKEVLEMVAGLGGRTTVFFSTHILSDVERVCDSVAILNHGRIITEARIEDLKESHGGHRILLDVNGGGEGFTRDLRAAPWLTELTLKETGTLELTVEDLETAQRALPRMIAERDLGLRRMEIEEASLESVFVELVEGAEA